MKKNMLKVLLLSTLYASVALTSSIGVANPNIQATGSTQAGQTQEVDPRTEGVVKKAEQAREDERVARENGRFDEAEKYKKQRQTIYENASKDAERKAKFLGVDTQKAENEKKTFEQKRKDAENREQDAKTKKEIAAENERVARENGRFDEEKKYKEEKEKFQKEETTARKERQKYAAKVQELDNQVKENKAEIKKLQADVEKFRGMRMDEAKEDGLFPTLMWRFRDMDEEVAKGKFAQSKKLNMKDTVAQDELLLQDTFVSLGELAQTENLAQKNTKTQDELLLQDRLVSVGDLAQAGNLKQKDRDVQEYMKYLDADKTLSQKERLAEEDRLTQEYMKYLDADETLPQGGRLAEEDRTTQEYMKYLDADGTLAQGGNLAQRDRDTQDTLISLDYEIWDLSFMGYHWWTMDYGLAREYALRPLEFGYFSYHAALHDTMGEFSSAEQIYSMIYDGLSLGVGLINGAAAVINGAQEVRDKIDEYKKDRAAERINEAKEGKEAAKKESEDFDGKTIAATNEAQRLLGEAEKADDQADYYTSKSQEYDEQAKKFYEEEQEWTKQGREDLAEQARSNKERAMMDSAEMLNKANEESKKASDARAASEVYQKQAEGYWQQKENADAAYRAYEATENEERQYLRERIGLDEAEANVANSQARMAQAQQEKAATEKDLSDVSNAKKMYNEQYDRSMKEAKAADDEAASYNLAAGKASEIGDMDSYNKYSQQASEAARRAEEMRSEADASKTLANSYGEAETRLKNTAASYEEQINAEKKYQDSAMATQKAKEAEYAVATGTATAEQKKLYEQAKQEEENSRFGQKATEWASKISTPGDIVRGAERTVSQGAGTVIEAAEDVGVGRAARTIGGMANTTRRLFGW